MKAPGYGYANHKQSNVSTYRKEQVNGTCEHLRPARALAGLSLVISTRKGLDGQGSSNNIHKDLFPSLLSVLGTNWSGTIPPTNG